MNKTGALRAFYEMGRGAERRTPDVSCASGQALEKAQNGNGRLLEKVGMDLGLAPRPLGFGAASAWVWRRVGLGLAPRPLGVGATPAWGWRRVGLGSTGRAFAIGDGVVDIVRAPDGGEAWRPGGAGLNLAIE